MNQIVKPNLTKEILSNDYQYLKSLNAIAKKYNLTLRKITQQFDELNIPRKRNSQYTINNNYFSNLNNPNIYYWIGFITADGNIYNGRLNLTLAIKDYNHLLNFKNDLEFSGDIKYILNKGSLRNPKWNDNTTCSIKFSCKNIIQDLKLFNIEPRKTYNTVFPKDIIPEKYWNIYYRGYVDGDGCFCYGAKHQKTPQLMFKLRGTESFLREFNNILVEKANLPSKSLDKKITIDSNMGTLCYNGNNIVTKIASWLYSDLKEFPNNRYLERKYDIVKHLII